MKLKCCICGSTKGFYVSDHGDIVCKKCKTIAYMGYTKGLREEYSSDWSDIQEKEDLYIGAKKRISF